MMGRISRLYNKLGDGLAQGCVGFFMVLSIAIACFFALSLPLIFVYEVFNNTFFYLFLFFWPDSPAFNNLFIFALSLCCGVMVIVALTVFFYRHRKYYSDGGSEKKDAGKERLYRKLLSALGLALVSTFVLSCIPSFFFGLIFGQGNQVFLTMVGTRSLNNALPFGSQDQVSLVPGDTLRLTNSTRGPLIVCVGTSQSCDAHTGLSILPGQTGKIELDQEGDYLMNCTTVVCNLKISVHPPPPGGASDDTGG